MAEVSMGSISLSSSDEWPTYPFIPYAAFLAEPLVNLVLVVPDGKRSLYGFQEIFTLILTSAEARYVM